MKSLLAAALLTTAALVFPAVAQARATAPATAATPQGKPKLIVAISVDQFSADLFAQYRNRYTDGLARLQQGVVFPSGYQSHAATETCPGHSTILTGMRPARTGIIANNWIDQRAGRPDKIVYCAEDERAPGSDHEKYQPSDLHLRVDTLGDMMKRADPRTRVVSVAGKDRAAIMMGGHNTDQVWFWATDHFVTLPSRSNAPVPAVVTRANDAVGKLFAAPQAALPLPGYCKGLAQPITVAGQTIGAGQFQRAGGDAKSFRASPALDGAVFALAAGMIQDMKLGQGAGTDLIAIGASATDYIGHALGTQGSEMCIQMAQLDQTIGAFLAQLDEWGLDYEVMLTADHGAHDMTERQQQRAMPMEEHASASNAAKLVGAAIGRELGIAGDVLIGPESDVYIADSVPKARRAQVLAEAKRRYLAMPQVAAAFTRDEIAATPFAKTPPEAWTLIERARASYDAERSGDLMVLLKPRVTTIVAPGPFYVETHGSPWDYDRRVPILFWRKGMVAFEQPLSVETVDIAPTLAATIGLPVSGLDGRCLDLDAGAGDSCPK
ncbi:alkaline phosphatase family protein [uncultured Sphingomonas sp.]|uniref:alkaline phosphatase family protein n=1 Tax=uncultured Sphingomonas sp. TaxID=158754 RepID=UPI0030F8464C